MFYILNKYYVWKYLLESNGAELRLSAFRIVLYGEVN